MIGQHLHDIERHSCTVCTNVLKYILLGRVKTQLVQVPSPYDVRVRSYARGTFGGR